jgi:hypothetical protein
MLSPANAGHSCSGVGRLPNLSRSAFISPFDLRTDFIAVSILFNTYLKATSGQGETNFGLTLYDGWAGTVHRGRPMLGSELR